jgi:hypothetical protein
MATYDGDRAYGTLYLEAPVVGVGTSQNDVAQVDAQGTGAAIGEPDAVLRGLE